MRQHLSYANVMATVALFIALGGSSYAAIKVTGKDVKDASLTGADIKNSTLGGPDIRAQAIRSSDVANGSLLQQDFAAGQLPAGAQGPKGDTGATGPKGEQGIQGVPGTLGNVVVRNLEAADIPPGMTRGQSVACAAGEIVVGGIARPMLDDGALTITVSKPVVNTESGESPSTGDPIGAWTGFATNTAATPRTLVVSVFCAQP